MDFAYTPAQLELKARAAAYAQLLMEYEDEAEGRRAAADGDGCASSPRPPWTPASTASTCPSSGAVPG